MAFLRHFLSYVPPEPPSEVPAEEPPDPSANRALSEPYRAARRILVALCALSTAWSSAQFGPDNLRLTALGMTADLQHSAIPVLLGAAIAYSTLRWIVEFAMMPRHVRRWRLAQADFRLVSIIVRLSVLVLSAGALDRSSRTLATVGLALGGLTLAALLLTLMLMLLTVPVRLRARQRAGRISAASAAVEAVFWAGLFAAVLAVGAFSVTAIASYWSVTLRQVLWRGVPDPVALAAFTFLVMLVFLSPWLLRPLVAMLFSKRPPYWTERMPDGSLAVHYLTNPREPLL